MDLQGLLPILLSWAVHISGYPMPEQPPELEFKRHSFFVEQVCGGRECAAMGWYNDKGIVYIDNALRDADGALATSVLVHELTHHLQHLSGKFADSSCQDSLLREREARRVQFIYVSRTHQSLDAVRPALITCDRNSYSASGAD